MYAITETSYRAVTADMGLNQGESRVTELPAALLTRIKAEQMKVERSQRLRSTDWTQMADAPLSVAAKTAWAVYRQALRDLPALPAVPGVERPNPPALDGAAGAAGEGDSVQLP